MIGYIILAPFLIIYALICYGCVVLFGKYKSRDFRLLSLLLAFFLTPILGIPIANWSLDNWE